MITLRELAAELSMDRSHLRKFVLALGVEPGRVRLPEYGNQEMLAIDEADAERVRTARRESGFTNSEIKSVRDVPIEGFLYLVQLDPQSYPERIKLGFATRPEERLSDYRCSNPNAVLIKKWACKRTWEKAAIDCISADDAICQHVGGEVFDAHDMPAVVGRGNAFFKMMPKPRKIKAVTIG